MCKCGKKIEYYYRVMLCNKCLVEYTNRLKVGELDQAEEMLVLSVEQLEEIWKL